MGFAEQMKAIALKVETRHKAVFDRCGELVESSIVSGSALTGAPGQPVGQYGPGYHPGEVGGTLKASWQREYLNANTQRVGIPADSPAIAYAAGIEDLVGPYGAITIRSSVGGGHSRKLTIAAWPSIVTQANIDVQGFANSSSGFIGEDGG